MDVRLSLVEFPADDPERALRFWTGLLGAELGDRSVEEVGVVVEAKGRIHEVSAGGFERAEVVLRRQLQVVLPPVPSRCPTPDDD